MAWGKGGSLKSCDALLKRVENNDPRLTELVILPMKTFGPSDLERLSSAIANGTNTNLQSISASGHHLPPQSLKQFGLALSSQATKKKKTAAADNDNVIHGITSLAIGSKDMGDVGVISLCEGLEESNGALLQFVDFGWKNLGKEGLCAIGKTFASSTSLKHIDLSRNDNVGNEGIISLANEAKKNAGDDTVAFPCLEKLKLSNCNIGSSGMQSLSDIILADNNNRSQPIDLTISCNPISSEGSEILAKICTIPDRGSMLSQLHLSQSSIGDEGVKMISTAATSSNSCIGMAVLDLSENSITKDGANEFAKSLVESWPDLVELKLAKNELGGEGVAMVMGALTTRVDKPSNDGSTGKKNSTLQNLDLTCTNCGIEGAKAALMSGGLTTLRLFNNRLGSDGFQAIAPLLVGGHPSIENLDLGGNNAGEEAVVALLNAIAKSEDGAVAAVSKLSVLEIGGNEFGEIAMEALVELKRAWPLLDVAHDKPVQEATEEEEE
ncbi:hypothetical protein ACHAXR_009687 [Thalassiosira sp. AJA248-18]